jgi:tRNA(His) 5'-end guanylyltransferase
LRRYGASVLAGMASAKFCQLVIEHLPNKVKETPHFDCRVWQVPTLQDAADVFVWREDDATKNSITMAAGAYYSDSELDGKNSGVKQEMLWQKGVNWNDFPAFFKRGTYLQRRTFDRTLTDEERARIPEAHRPSTRCCSNEQTLSHDHDGRADRVQWLAGFGQDHILPRAIRCHACPHQQGCMAERTQEGRAPTQAHR